MKILNIKKIIKYLLATTIFVAFVSCSKENTPILFGGQALVKINIVGSEAREQINLKSTSLHNNNALKDRIQVIEIPFNNDFVLEASLTLDKKNTINIGTNDPLPNQTKSDIGIQKATAETLPSNSKYRVIVYANTGQYVDQVVYTMGTETGQELQLIPGNSYTFVCVSYGTTTEPPPVPSTLSLSQEKYTNLSSAGIDLMYTSISKTLVAGNNNLNLILKHKFCQIKTSINASAIGSISSINNVRITPHYNELDLKLSDGTTDFQPFTTSYKTLTFPNPIGSTITANPIIIAAASGNNGGITIGNISINGITKTNLPIENLKIIQGERYNLIITLKKNSSIEVDDIVWSTGNLVYNGPNSYSQSPYGELGNYFPYNRLIPATLVPFTSNKLGDPCKKLLMDTQNNPNGNLWRMPTFIEIATFTKDETGDRMHDRFSIQNVNGNTGLIRKDTDLFFPHSNGYYSPASNKGEPGTQGSYTDVTNSLIWVGNTNFWQQSKIATVDNQAGWKAVTQWGSSENYEFGMQVRCVRSK